MKIRNIYSDHEKHHLFSAFLKKKKKSLFFQYFIKGVSLILTFSNSWTSADTWATFPAWAVREISPSAEWQNIAQQEILVSGMIS